jgi:tetratricopeptide (TPR) repeat protein
MRKAIILLWIFFAPQWVISQSAQDYYKAAMIKLVSNRYQEAVNDFDRAIKANPKMIDAYFNRGIAYEKLGKTENAVRDYTKVIKLDAGMNEAYINRGLLYRKQKKFDAAIKDFDKAIDLRPDFAFAYLYRADTYFEMNDLAKAKKDYERVLQYLPNYIRANERLAIINYQQKNYETALPYAAKLCEIESSKSKNFLLRGKILMALSRNEPACKDLKHAADMGSAEAAKLLPEHCK